MLRKIYIKRLWKIEEKTASHHYQATKERCRKETTRIWRWTAARKKSRLVLERPCLQKARQWVTRRTQNRELLVLKLTSYTDAWASNAYTRQEEANILLNYCNIEDITGKLSTQLKAPVLILNPNGTTTTSLFLTLNIQISHHLQIARLIEAFGV